MALETRQRQLDTERRLELLAAEVSARPIVGAGPGIAACEVAAHEGWLSETGYPHTNAIVLACLNAGLDIDGQMFQVQQEVTGVHDKPQFFLTLAGLDRFRTEIIACFTGNTFDVTPNQRATALGRRATYHVHRKSALLSARVVRPVTALRTTKE